MAKAVTLEDALADEEQREQTPAPAAPAAAAPKQEVRGDAGGGRVKLTIELEADLHRQLKRFALLEAEDASLASLIRAAVVVMSNNERYAKAVIKEAVNQKRRRG